MDKGPDVERGTFLAFRLPPRTLPRDGKGRLNLKLLAGSPEPKGDLFVGPELPRRSSWPNTHIPTHLTPTS
jgi:hypothetical protein